MRKITKIITGGIISSFMWVVLVGCNLPLNRQESTPDATGVYYTAVAITTERAGTLGSLSSQPASTLVPEVITPTPGTMIPTEKTVSIVLPSEDSICDLVRPGIPFDVTIPDDTRLQPGETFTKVWRFVNKGSCTWTQNYSIVWFSGDDLGVEKVQAFSDSVSPGDIIDISVDMIAPTTPGVYSSYWMLRNDRGGLFGLGPNGDAAFWARIQVIAVNTSTPTLTVVPTATPVVEISGSATLETSQTFDLDSGLIAQDKSDDLILNLTADDQVQLVPTNNTRLAEFGTSQPSIVDCRGAVLSIEPLILSGMEKGIYLCYRTNQGLPGFLKLNQIPSQEVPMAFEFLTWASP
jgi:hypothetical protein